MEQLEPVLRSVFDRPKISLANIPTPLEFAFELSKKINRNIFIKRDDLTGAPLTGNKVRKLEYILADAKIKKASSVMTCGATTSNHARATAIAARIAGLKPYLLLKKYNEPEKDHNNANIFLMRLVGAEIRFCDDEGYEKRNEIMLEWKKQLNDNVYIIPEGGSNEIGIIGYIEAFREIVEDCKRINIKLDGIITAVGSGGTYAGLLIGKALFEYDIPIYGYSVWRNPSYYKEEIAKIIARFEESYYCKLNLTDEDIKIIDASYGY
ncbi:MAG: 1-aminocyclopropane-1-carboxylate deaminase/D-cysteine desulfhydrase, partial [bacterium]